MSGKSVTLILPMTQGNHNIVVRYRQYTNTAYVYFTWVYGISTATPTPPPSSTPACDPWWSCSCPTQATSVTTQFGDYTSCIQQTASINRTASSRTASGTRPTWGRSKWSRRSRYGETARRASSSACSWHATKSRCRPTARRLRQAGSTTAPARRRRRRRCPECHPSPMRGPRPPGPRMGFEREQRVGVMMGH